MDDEVADGLAGAEDVDTVFAARPDVLDVDEFLLRVIAGANTRSPFSSNTVSRPNCNPVDNRLYFLVFDEGPVFAPGSGNVGDAAAPLELPFVVVKSADVTLGGSE